MDPQKIKRLRSSLTIHFACISFLTAMLVAAGSESYILPVVILFFSVGGYLFVDRWEVFELGRIGSYFGMTFATGVAVATYLYNVVYVFSEAGQLTAVAGLLVYPEAVLFLQRKTLRVYEQLSIFLLLEMIVAALINDNILFGILLTPIIILWVSALFLASRYAAILRLDPTIEKPVPLFAELVYNYVRKQVFTQQPEKRLATVEIVPAQNYQSSRAVRRTLQALPLGFGAIVFAMMFFYLLPRTLSSNLPQGLGVKPRVGLPNRMTIGNFGKILRDETPVMRVSFKNYRTGQLYELSEQPYIRSRIFDNYRRSRNGGLGEWTRANAYGYFEMPTIDAVRPNMNANAEVLLTEFNINKQFSSNLFCFNSSFRTTKRQSVGLSLDYFNGVLRSLGEGDRGYGKSVVYSLGTANFNNGIQIRVTPANIGQRGISPATAGNLLSGSRSFQAIEPFRQRVLADANVENGSPYQIAQALESHLSTSGEFSYTLDLQPPDPSLDPLEDFVLNQKRGHCQYYAGTLTMLLRMSNIPCRMVVGYNPSEYNKVGNYFLVKQLDAHAWVEALFRREHLAGTELEPYLTEGDDLFWVRFDATPASANIEEQNGQAIDYAEKLWKDYIVNAQKLTGQDSFYAPVAENSKDAYQAFIQQLKDLRDSLETGDFGKAGASIRSLALPLALIALLAIGSVLLTLRFTSILPKLAPRLAKRLGFKVRSKDEYLAPFYRKVIQLLKRAGYERAPHITPQELTSQAAEGLSPENTPTGDILKFLTQQYYRLRFSNAEISPEQMHQIERSIDQLERATQKSNILRKEG